MRVESGAALRACAGAALRAGAGAGLPAAAGAALRAGAGVAMRAGAGVALRAARRNLQAAGHASAVAGAAAAGAPRGLRPTFYVRRGHVSLRAAAISSQPASLRAAAAVSCWRGSAALRVGVVAGLLGAAGAAQRRGRRSAAGCDWCMPCGLRQAAAGCGRRGALVGWAVAKGQGGGGGRSVLSGLYCSILRKSRGYLHVGRSFGVVQLFQCRCGSAPDDMQNACKTTNKASFNGSKYSLKYLKLGLSISCALFDHNAKITEVLNKMSIFVFRWIGTANKQRILILFAQNKFFWTLSCVVTS